MVLERLVPLSGRAVFQDLEQIHICPVVNQKGRFIKMRHKVGEGLSSWATGLGLLLTLSLATTANSESEKGPGKLRPKTGLLSHWCGDRDFTDSAGQLEANPVGDVGFVEGIKCSAFDLRSEGARIEKDAVEVGRSFSLALWFRRADQETSGFLDEGILSGSLEPRSSRAWM